MSPTLGLEGVIGESEAMEKVFQVVHRVAGTRATLLIRGESGTGKEVVARAIHAAGPFAGQPFVTVDCTNIPANLMESELFGHERGAFTDAKSQKPGLMEMADGGSIFLDEIGLMPLELQSKLLNVLETQRFRRVGRHCGADGFGSLSCSDERKSGKGRTRGEIPGRSVLSTQRRAHRLAAA